MQEAEIASDQTGAEIAGSSDQTGTAIAGSSDQTGAALAAESAAKRMRTSTFRATAAAAAASLTDCAKLPNNVLMPWVGFGTCAQQTC